MYENEKSFCCFDVYGYAGSHRVQARRGERGSEGPGWRGKRGAGGLGERGAGAPAGLRRHRVQQLYIVPCPSGVPERIRGGLH
ncbi:hypothetical protein D5270_07980 [Acutalibacter sp. 1XD8-36]|nr:hypothetical protein [Acutalibacter sp. 1XD8-36]